MPDETHYPGAPSALPEDSRSSTIAGMVRVAVSNGDPIPLTLTLSHGEREQPAAGSIVREVRRADTALGCAERQRRILPLHALPFPSPLTPLPSDGRGEDRGEGKGDARCADRIGTSPWQEPVPGPGILETLSKTLSKGQQSDRFVRQSFRQRHDYALWGQALTRACCKSPFCSGARMPTSANCPKNPSDVRADVGIRAPILPLSQQPLTSYF